MNDSPVIPEARRKCPKVSRAARTDDAPYATAVKSGEEGSVWDDFGRFRRASGIPGGPMIVEC